MPLDPIELTVFSNLFASVAEEMGVTLGRAAYSPNIKERRDFSCAVFDAGGRMVAQAAHIPVHLGAMPAAVRVARERHSFGPGDLVIFPVPPIPFVTRAAKKRSPTARTRIWQN